VLEREPIMGSGGGVPSGGLSAELLVGGLGRQPPEANEVFEFKTVIFNGSAAVLHDIVNYLYF